MTVPSGALTVGSMKTFLVRAVRVHRAARAQLKTLVTFATRSHLATRVAARSACRAKLTHAANPATRLLALSSLVLRFLLLPVRLPPPRLLLPRQHLLLPSLPLPQAPRHITPFALVSSALQLKVQAPITAFTIQTASLRRTPFVLAKRAFPCQARE